MADRPLMRSDDGAWFGMPACFRRTLRPGLLGLSGLVLIVALTKALALFGHVSLRASGGVSLVCPVGTTFFFAWTSLRQRALWAALDEARDLLCLRCGYRLDGGIPARACPECGRAFDPGSTRDAWRRLRARTIPARTTWGLLAMAVALQLLGVAIILPLLL